MASSKPDQSRDLSTMNNNKVNPNNGRQLLILRHGKSSWEVDVNDYYRPLKQRGIDAAQKIGLWLQNTALIPDIIISSPATRAMATATEVEKVIDVPEIRQDERIYGETVAQLLEVLSEIPEGYERPLIVGHNPGIEGLLLYLASVSDQYYQDWKLMTTGTLAILTMPKNWLQLDEQCAQLVDLVRGRDL